MNNTADGLIGKLMDLRRFMVGWLVDWWLGRGPIGTLIGILGGLFFSKLIGEFGGLVIL